MNNDFDEILQLFFIAWILFNFMKYILFYKNGAIYLITLTILRPTSINKDKNPENSLI